MLMKRSRKCKDYINNNARLLVFSWTSNPVIPLTVSFLLARAFSFSRQTLSGPYCICLAENDCRIDDFGNQQKKRTPTSPAISDIGILIKLNYNEKSCMWNKQRFSYLHHIPPAKLRTIFETTKFFNANLSYNFSVGTRIFGTDAKLRSKTKRYKHYVDFFLMNKIFS